MTTPESRRIAAPRPPGQPAPFRFPLIASLAPLVAALALWLMTGSPFALLFAVLGPVTAVASFADSKFGSRRSTKRELVRFAQDVAATVASIQIAHDVERSDLVEIAPGAEAIVSRRGADPCRWTTVNASPILVRAGLGTIPSTVSLASPARPIPSIVDSDLDEMERLVATLTDAPVLIDARLGVGICGPPVLAIALARAVALQLAWSLSPANHWVAGGPHEPSWMSALPHHVQRAARAGFFVEFGTANGDQIAASVAVALNERDLPGECRVVIRVAHAASAEIIKHPDRTQRRILSPGVVSAESAMEWAVRATREASRDGLISSGRELPHSVTLESLLTPTGVHERSLSLPAEFAVDEGGAVTIDIVSQGPHAVVGGTTGSGKSELLISWVLALAMRHSPADLTVLLLDFKGGSAFESLAVLPHCVGIITDLDAVQAARALASLRAELKHRERSLAAASARHIQDLPPTGPSSMPRLVIVVDEFAAMLADHPDLHPLFTDIASRGRSLGVHLILCTQRPAGIVRDAVLANADLRVSLRVNNGADSAAVVGTTSAAELPASAVGRGLLACAGEPPHPVQFAIAGPSDPAAVALRWKDSAPPRRPWCDPLPVPLHSRSPELAGPSSSTASVSFGLVDLPNEQRRAAAEWDARVDGHVLVLGAARSGKSTALAALARGGILVPSDIAGAWDCVAELDDAHNRVVAIDDLDSLVARFSGEHKDALIDRLVRLLRDGPARGIILVLAAQRLTADLNPFASLVAERLMLRHSTKSEFVLAGGDGTAYEASLPQGGGTWRGARVQVICDPDPLRCRPAVELGCPPRTRPWVVVSGRASIIGKRLAAAGFEVLPLATLMPGQWEAAMCGGEAIVGDVDEWQSRWGLLPTLRPHAEVVFDECTVADYRALMRVRALPPPLIGLADAMWLDGENGITRAILPESLP